MGQHVSPRRRRAPTRASVGWEDGEEGGGLLAGVRRQQRRAEQALKRARAKNSNDELYDNLCVF